MVRRRRDGAARRQALIDAALACFSERGVTATGIEHVRRKAGASPSSVYHLFPSLEALKLALLQRIFDQLFAAITAPVCRTRTAKGAVVALVRAHVDWVLSHPVEARVMYQMMSLELDPEVASQLAAHKAGALEGITQHVAQFIASGDLPRWSVLELDVAILGPAHEACRRFLGGAPLDPKWMRNTLPRLAWKSIAPA